ncbi:MAG: nucleotidyltransferase family protein [Clostridia bacterium]|nr:nucleotidyltransferase family protein [Clostridia bacterium]
MKAVILAGGRGSRLMPLTKNLPKPLIPIVDKPIIDYIIEGIKKAGIDEVIVTLGYLGNKIRNYLGNGKRYGIKIRYSYETFPLGTAGGVKNAAKYLDDDFIVMSGDAYTDLDVKDLIENAKGLVTIAAHYEADASRFGVMKVGENGLITEFEEKPENPKSHLVNMGIYVFKREILSYIPNGFYDFSKDLFPRLIGDIYAYESDCFWSDIGTLPSYYSTNYHVVCENAN